MKWIRVTDPVGGTYWYAELPNGWTAGVSDHSQTYAPRRKTEYCVSAICKSALVGWPHAVKTFAEAKKLAVELAMAQDPKRDERWLSGGGA